MLPAGKESSTSMRTNPMAPANLPSTIAPGVRWVQLSSSYVRASRSAVMLVAAKAGTKKSSMTIWATATVVKMARARSAPPGLVPAAGHMAITSAESTAR